MFPLIDMVVLYMQRSEKLFDQVEEAPMLFTPVLQYKIVGQSVFKQRYCNSVLSVEMLCKKKRSKGFFYALEFGIEGTIVEMDLIDDRIAFNVVVIVIEF